MYGFPFGASSSHLKIALNQRRNSLTEHEQNLHDLAALFAMEALLSRGEHYDTQLHIEAFRQADLFMKERKKTHDQSTGPMGAGI